MGPDALSKYIICVDGEPIPSGIKKIRRRQLFMRSAGLKRLKNKVARLREKIASAENGAMKDYYKGELKKVEERLTAETLRQIDGKE